MSNLVKQYFVTNESTPVRVINSSRKFEEKLKRMEKEAQDKIERNTVARVEFEAFSEDEFPDLENGEFVEGLEALQVEAEESMPTPDIAQEREELLAEARAEAQAIIDEANASARQTIEEANAQVEELFEEKKKLGYDEGYKEASEEIDALRQQLEEEISTRSEELQKEFDLKSEQLESDIVDAVICVFNKVFHIQFDNKKELLLHLIKNTLMNVEVGKEFRIHVSENNYKFINSRLGDIRERIGNDVEIEVVNDAALDSSDCQIETSFGVFDCGIDMELSNLLKDIKSLSC